MSFMINQIIRRNKNNIYIYIYIYGYLINCEYLNNLNEDRDMAGTCIMAGICISPSSSPSPSPSPIEKIGDSPYPYPYPVNAGIPRQNRDGFGQYPRGRIYLPSLSRAQPTTFSFLLYFIFHFSLSFFWPLYNWEQNSFFSAFSLFHNQFSDFF